MATFDSPAGGAGTLPRVGPDMVQLVEQLFDAFTECTFEYHKTVSARADGVSIEKPVHLKPGDPRYGSHGGASFTGRLALREWSLMVRGQPEKIDGVIIASDQLFHYRADPDSFGKFFAIELKPTGDSAAWMVGRKPLSLDQLPVLAKQLHAALLRAAKRGKATATFRFSTGKTTTIDAVSLPLDTQASGGLPQRPRSYYEDTDTVFAALNPGAPPEDTSPPASPSPRPTQQSAPDIFDVHAAASKSISVSEALRIAFDGLSAELDAIQQAVTQSFEFGDSTGAEKLVKRSALVKDMQERAHLLCQDWLQVKPGG